MDVLIIDDEEPVRKMLTKVLEQAGFMVTAVENGLAALAELGTQEYRAVVCDLQMPFLEGHRFFEELRAQYPHLAQRLVWVTGYAEDPRIRGFIEKSGRPVVPKPVDFAQLVKVVQEVADQEG